MAVVLAVLDNATLRCMGMQWSFPLMHSTCAMLMYTIFSTEGSVFKFVGPVLYALLEQCGHGLRVVLKSDRESRPVLVSAV